MEGQGEERQTRRLSEGALISLPTLGAPFQLLLWEGLWLQGLFFTEEKRSKHSLSFSSVSGDNMPPLKDCWERPRRWGRPPSSSIGLGTADTVVG